MMLGQIVHVNNAEESTVWFESRCTATIIQLRTRSAVAERARKYPRVRICHNQEVVCSILGRRVTWWRRQLGSSGRGGSRESFDVG